MKKVIITFFVVMLFGAVSVNAQVVWGIRAGVEIPSLSMKYSYSDEDYSESGKQKLKGLVGIEIGPTAYFSFNTKLYLNVAALYSMKRFDLGYNASLTMHYGEIPVYLGYRIPIGSNVETYLQAGPYIGFKLAESLSGEDAEAALSGEDTAGEGAESGFNTIDAGLALMYGVNISRFKVELGVKFGLTNLTSGSEWNGSDGWGSYTTTTHMISPFLGISYVF